jgi:hypothetical protein
MDKGSDYNCISRVSSGYSDRVEAQDLRCGAEWLNYGCAVSTEGLHSPLQVNLTYPLRNWNGVFHMIQFELITSYPSSSSLAVVY